MGQNDMQFLVSFIVTIIIGVPLTLLMQKKMSRQGKDIRHLPFQIALVVATSLLIVMMAFDDNLSLIGKATVVAGGLAGGICYYLGLIRLDNLKNKLFNQKGNGVDKQG